MKKIILIAAMALGFVVTAVAQPRAIGVRFGNGLEVSYQHTLDNNFIQADLGLMGFGANINANATYNWTLAKPQWTDRGEWSVYAGPGAGLGLGWIEGASYFNIGVVGMVGLEYTFWFPLQLSIDLRPQIGCVFAKNVGAAFYSDSWVPALSVRYRF